MMGNNTDLNEEQLAAKLRQHGSILLDLKVSWSGVLPLLLAAYADGTEKGRRMALEDLTRMAKIADAYVAEHKDDGDVPTG